MRTWSPLEFFFLFFSLASLLLHEREVVYKFTINIIVFNFILCVIFLSVFMRE